MWGAEKGIGEGGKGMLLEGCMKPGVMWGGGGWKSVIVKRVSLVRGGEGGIDTFLNALLPTLLDAPIFPGVEEKRQYIKS